MKDRLLPAVLMIAAALAGCSRPADHQPTAPAPTSRPALAAEALPPYKQSPKQVDAFLRSRDNTVGTIGERAVAIARLNLGQPYDIYLLGEAPFETVDAQPVFCLEKSDCVVAVEHEVAMAMTDDFPSFLRLLQRIRYKDGEIGVRTRNHYTEADWNVNNAWLATDITEQVAGDSVKTYPIRVNRTAFFKQRYKLAVDVPVERLETAYVPYAAIESVKPKLRTGDIFNVVKGHDNGSAWVHHLGLIAVTPEGGVNVIHASQTAGKLIEEPIEAYIAGNLARDKRLTTTRPTLPSHRGFKFLRINEDALARLKAIDGDAMPKVTLPADSPVTFDAFIAQTLGQP